jgi:hypothetical protein
MDFFSVVIVLIYHIKQIQLIIIGNEAIIYNGRGVINETNDFITLIYDGNIDLYKSKIQH